MLALSGVSGQVVRPQLEQEFAALAQSDFAPSPYTSWLSPPVIAGLVHLVRAKF